MTADELGLPNDVIEHLAEIRNDRLPEAIAADLPEGTRQILLVDRHRLITANWADSSAAETTGSASTILLTGRSSPSSHAELDRAYITVVRDAETVRGPHYVRARGAIYLFIHHRNLETLLSQIHEPDVYCWIGHFPGGHLYGDIHTAHR